MSEFKESRTNVCLDFNLVLYLSVTVRALSTTLVSFSRLFSRVGFSYKELQDTIIIYFLKNILISHILKYLLD